MLPLTLKLTNVLTSSLLTFLFLSIQFLSSPVEGAYKRVVVTFHHCQHSLPLLLSIRPRFGHITSASDSPRFIIRKLHHLSSLQPQFQTRSVKMQVEDNNLSNKDDTITILGFGSLLSQKSSRVTFPTLRNFRLGRVRDHRRVFAHPASIFFQRGIANLDTLEMSSLRYVFTIFCQ